MGRASLLTVVAASFVISIMNMSIHRSAEQSVAKMVRYYSESVARVIAKEGMCYVLTQLADSSTLRQKSPKSLPTNLFADMGPYSGVYTITSDSILIDGVRKKVLKLLLYVTYLKATDTVVVYADSSFGFRPKAIRGAFTANDTINAVISDMVIDGRDHDLNGNLLSNGKGVFGVSTSVPFFNKDKGAIGGTTASGVDVAPTFPENSSIIEQNYDWQGGFPNTPDGALGYPEGKLQTMAVSGIGGSQYVKVNTATELKNLNKKVPTNMLGLRAPLSGITYVDLAPGLEWNGGFFENSTGILIVHNSTGNAHIKGLKQAVGAPPFKGIIIADWMFHMHMDLIGAVILLSKSLDKTDVCNGNADHKVLFSNEAVRQATGVAVSYGSGWQGTVPIIGWLDAGVYHPRE